MKVDLLCFGVLKDLFGRDQDSVELGAGASVGDLLRSLEERGRQDHAVWKALAVAVNREYAGLGTVLKDGDEVALLPPVSGGCFTAADDTNPMSQKRDMGHPGMCLGGCVAR